MKKILISIFALLAATLSVFAENDDKLTFGNDVFVVKPISYLGFGYQIKSGYPGNAGFSDEFFVNAMELGIRPFENGLISIGVDYKMDTYRLDKQNFWGADENNGTVWKNSASSLPGGATLKSSRLRVNTFAIPLSFQIKAGKSAFRIGAAGEYNLPANVVNRSAKDGDITKVKAKGLKTNEFTYSLFGSISYNGLGIYVRYRPAYQFNEGIGPHFQNLSAGIVLGIN